MSDAKKDKTPKKPPAPKWSEETVALAALRPYERNPRSITKEAFAALKKSLKEDGYHSRIKVTPDLRVIGGHQRIRALSEMGVNEVKVLVPDRELTEEEYRRLLVKDNLDIYGTFDTDMLASDFEREELASWGVPDSILGDLPQGFAPGDEDDQGKLDEKAPVVCPECGHEFQP